MRVRYRPEDLRQFAFDLLCKQEMSEPLATTVADILLEGDLLGHTTHGLQLLGPYLKELQQGTMTPDGMPVVLQDHGMAGTGATCPALGWSRGPSTPV